MLSRRRGILGLALLATAALPFAAILCALAGNAPRINQWITSRSKIEIARRHSVVMQLTGIDCGPAAVDNLLSLYRLSVPLPVLEAEMHPSSIGTPIDDVAAAISRRGLQARVVHVSASAWRSLHRPFIALVRQHYVVVVDVLTPMRVEVMDPASGDEIETSSRLEQMWSGWAVVIT